MPFACWIKNRSSDGISSRRTRSPAPLRSTILSYHLWERRYAKDPGIIGQTVRINSTPASWGTVDMLTSTPTTVIGVMPPDFRFPLHRVDLWLPLVPTAGMLFPRDHDRQSGISCSPSVDWLAA